jgi:hypothetical protein
VGGLSRHLHSSSPRRVPALHPPAPDASTPPPSPAQATAFSGRASVPSAPAVPMTFTQQLPRPVMTGRQDGAIAITLDRSNKARAGRA